MPRHSFEQKKSNLSNYNSWLYQDCKKELTFTNFEAG